MPRTRELDDPRRRILVQALSLGLISALPASLARAQTFGAPAKLPPGQSVYRIVGTVTVNDKPADLKTVVNPGDTLKTGKGGEIVVVMGSQCMLVRGASEVIIERPPDPSILTRGLRVLRGALLSVSRNTPMQLRTNTGTIGIRGTGFYVESQEDQTYFCTCYGASEIASVTEPARKETITATHHDRPVYILAGDPSGRNIRNAPFINHTDQELALIETLVGREPPFVFPKDSYTAPRRGY
jgi:hypothetical protein